jgi:hypothetical protein
MKNFLDDTQTSPKKTNIVRGCFVLFVALAGSSLGSAAANEKHWPYHQLPHTSFSKVIGPHAMDATFLINGRPVGFSKVGVDLQDLERQISETLKDAEEAARFNGQPVVVSTESIDYLTNVKQTLASLGNPRLSMAVDGDAVRVTYTPAFQRLGDADITLYDALASICARQRQFQSSYQNMLKSLARKRELYGANSDEAAQQLVDMAALNEDTHNYIAAEKFYKQAQDIVVSLHGPHSKDTGKQAIAIMDMLGVKHAGYGLPMSAHHSWIPITQDIAGIVSAVAQDASRQKADVQGMRDTLFAMIHEKEIAERKRREAEESAIRDARRQKILEENEKLLGSPPNIGGICFVNAAKDIAGSIHFFPSGKCEIESEYKKLDGQTQPPRVEGDWRVEDESQSDKPAYVVHVTSTADKRIDKWHIRLSDVELGEIRLEAFERKEPYPSMLKGRSKVKVPPEVRQEILNIKPDTKKHATGLVPPPPPNP